MASNLLLKNGRVVDPSKSLDQVADILIENGRIAGIGPGLNSPDAALLNLSGLVVAPGFIDMHVHLREPGKEEAETIATGTMAAAAGGFTAVACMANTQPVNDNIQTIEFILQKASVTAAVPVYPIAAVTLNLAGETLTDMEALRKAGVIAFSDDGKPVFNSRLMQRALEIAGELGCTVIDHCEDPYLFTGGSINEGIVADQSRLKGIPPAAEEIMVSRNILLSKHTGMPVHLAHLSTAGSIDLVRRAKKEGIRVTAEVTPHHFTLTQDAVKDYGTNAKMNPPLRSEQDMKAVLVALADGTIDAIASDHAPHHSDTKKVPFADAAFGIIGLETSVSLGLQQLHHTGLVSLPRFVDLYCTGPARILGISRGITVGADACFTILDTALEVRVDAKSFHSKSRNTPFDGWSLRGAAVASIAKGKLVWSHSNIRIQP